MSDICTGKEYGAPELHKLTTYCSLFKPESFDWHKNPRHLSLKTMDFGLPTPYISPSSRKNNILPLDFVICVMQVIGVSLWFSRFKNQYWIWSLKCHVPQRFWNLFLTLETDSVVRCHTWFSIGILPHTENVLMQWPHEQFSCTDYCMLFQKKQSLPQVTWIMEYFPAQSTESQRI